jgi:hypothetical protein
MKLNTSHKSRHIPHIQLTSVLALNKKKDPMTVISYKQKHATMRSFFVERRASPETTAMSRENITKFRRAMQAENEIIFAAALQKSKKNPA